MLLSFPVKPLLSFVLLSILFFPGCATILNDDHQMVAFSSDPEGALVSVDAIPMGETPCVLPIQRKGFDKQITFELEGYNTLQVTLKNKLHGAALGNILLGGIIGGVVDAVSGRGGKYQDSLRVVMTRGMGTLAYKTGKKGELIAIEPEVVETEDEESP